MPLTPYAFNKKMKMLQRHPLFIALFLILLPEFASLFTNAYPSFVNQPTVLAPLPTHNGTAPLAQLALIIAHPSEWPSYEFLPLVKAIQTHFQGVVDVALWIGIAPIAASSDIDVIVSAIKVAGFHDIDPARTFVAGYSHSAGSLVIKNAKPYAGIMLWGSFLKSTDVGIREFARPLLQLTGELDPIASPAKISMLFREYLKFRRMVGEEIAIKSKPVVVIPHLSHTQFTSSWKPGFMSPYEPSVRLRDIPAARFFNIDTLHNTLAHVVSSFIILNMPTSKRSVTPHALASETLRIVTHNTRQILHPFLEAFSVSNNDWCVEMQKVVAGDRQALLKLRIENVFHETREKFLSARPSFDLGVIKTHNYLEPPQGTYGTPTSLDCKSFTRDAVFHYVGDAVPEPIMESVISEEREGDCAEMNNMAIDIAESLVNEDQITRYRNYGVQLKTVDDIWIEDPSIWADLDVTYRRVRGHLEVASPKLKTRFNKTMNARK